MEDSFLKEKLDAFLNPFFIKEKIQTGVEFEFAIISLDKRPVSLKVIHKLNDFLLKFMSFEIFKTNSNDDTPISFKNKLTNDLISYECSFNTLEFALEPSINLKESSIRFYKYFERIQDFLLSEKHILSGLGIHPFFEMIDTSPLNSDYYIQMYKFLATADKYETFHSYNDFCSFTCASQTQLDVDPEQLPKVLSFLNKTSWISALLFSNSSILYNRPENIPNNFCARDFLLDNSYFGSNPDYIGIFNEKCESFERIYESLANVPFNYTKRNGHFYFFEPIPFKDYFYKKEIIPIGNNSNNNTLKIIPEDNDIDYFRPKKNISLTKKGTIEIRQDCQQRPKDSFSTAAYYTGILNVIPEVNKLLESFDYKNDDIRTNIINDNFQNFTSKKEASELILHILELISGALIKRNYGEELFLKPLFKRAEELCSPGKENLQKIKNGTDIISVIKYNSK